MIFIKQSKKENNNMNKQQAAWENSLENVSPSPPVLRFRQFVQFVPVKTPAGLDLQICPEIEESAWREILKQSGACFFPSPDLTCPIWGSPFLQIFSFSLFACFSYPNYEACQKDPEIPASYFVHLILAPKSPY